MTTNQVRRCTRAATAMQRLTDALAGGLVHWVADWVDATKWPTVEAKLTARYPDLARDRFHAARLRRGGSGVHRLVTFAPKGAERVRFILLTDLPDDAERWQDATAKTGRLPFWDFEAVRLTKAQAKTPPWTWRVQRGAYEARRVEAIESIRKGRDELLARLTQDLAHWPGFAGVRRQHQSMGRLIAGEWIRSRSEPCPPWPRLGYIRRRRTA